MIDWSDDWKWRHDKTAFCQTGPGKRQSQNDLDWNTILNLSVTAPHPVQNSLLCVFGNVDRRRLFPLRQTSKKRPLANGEQQRTYRKTARGTWTNDSKSQMHLPIDVGLTPWRAQRDLRKQTIAQYRNKKHINAGEKLDSCARVTANKFFCTHYALRNHRHSSQQF